MHIEEPRIPPAVNGIQINHCKNPRCANFGIPAADSKQPRGPGASERNSDQYTLSGDSRGTVRLVCKLCKDNRPIKSNLAISEELDRQLVVFETLWEPSCPSNKCPNHAVGLSDGAHEYYQNGKTRTGAQRYRCRQCSATFSVSTHAVRQSKSHSNLAVFRALVNKMPLRGIARSLGLSENTVYRKIALIERQCLQFLASRESKLLDGFALCGLSLAIDRQEYIINWPSIQDRRNVTLRAIGCADNITRYVFGVHLDFDPHMDMLQTSMAALQTGDIFLRPPYRRFARVWLPDELTGPHPLIQAFQDLREAGPEAFTAPPVLAPGHEDYGDSFWGRIKTNSKLPENGMQVHTEYAMYGHLFFLRKILSGAKHIHFFLDQEPGLREAVMVAFGEMIQEGRCHAFFVTINKQMTQPQKLSAKAQGDALLERLREDYPYDLTDAQLRRLHLEGLIQAIRHEKDWRKRWVHDPFHTMRNPFFLDRVSGFDWTVNPV